jgi:hypothetical protein
MRRSVLVVGSLLLSAFVASATDVSQYGLFLGYDFTRFNPPNSFWPSFNANGGDGQFSYNFNKWIAAAVDMGAANSGTWSHYSINTTVAHLVAGPRFTYHRGRFQPFAQVLFGGGYGSSSTQIDVVGAKIVSPPSVSKTITPPVDVNPNIPLSVRVVSSRGGFAMLAGGGIDIKISKHVNFRPIGADYFLMRLPTLSNFIGGSSRANWNNFRYTTGFNFTWGRE